MKTIHRFRAFLLLALASFFLAACSTLDAPPTMVFTDADMARLLEQHGPFQRRLLEVLDVRVQRPSVKLLAATNRLASVFDVSATERMSRTTLNGRLEVEYALRYDPEEQAIRMTQVRVDDFQLNNVPPEKKAGMQRLGTLIAEYMLEDAVLYRFKPADLRNAEGRGVRPGAVTVTSRGVEVTLAPTGR